MSMEAGITWISVTILVTTYLIVKQAHKMTVLSMMNLCC